jgi:hypothetical protein
VRSSPWWLPVQATVGRSGSSSASVGTPRTRATKLPSTPAVDRDLHGCQAAGRRWWQVRARAWCRRRHTDQRSRWPRSVTGRGDQGREQVLDLVAGQRDKPGRWRPAEAFGHGRHHQEGMGEHCWPPSVCSPVTHRHPLGTLLGRDPGTPPRRSPDPPALLLTTRRRCCCTRSWWHPIRGRAGLRSLPSGSFGEYDPRRMLGSSRGRTAPANPAAMVQPEAW